MPRVCGNISPGFLTDSDRALAVNGPGLILTLRRAVILWPLDPRGGLEAQVDSVDFAIALTPCR